MIVRPWALVPLLAPFAYVSALLLAGFPEGAVGVWVVFAACAAVAGLAVHPRPIVQSLRLAAFGILVAVVLVAAAGAAAFGSAASDLAVGLLLGLLPVAAMLVARTDAATRDRVIVYGATLAWGLILLTARASLGGSYTGPELLRAIDQVNNVQVTGLVGLLDGAGFTSLPIHALFDPWFAALAGVSMFGLVLDLVRPRSGAGDPLPVASRTARDGESERELHASIGFSPAQRAVFRARSVPEPSPATWPPGLAAVAWGAGAVAVFLALSAATSDFALLVLLAAALAVAVGLVVLADVPEAAAWLPFGPARIQPPPAEELEEWLATTDPGAAPAFSELEPPAETSVGPP
jgi:hypothetical protein